MKSLSVRVPDGTHDRIENRAEERGTSVSAEAREFVTRGFRADDLEDEVAALRERLEAREDRIEDLEEQLRERSRVEEKIEALPDKVRDTESYQERRQRLLDEASLAERVKWKLIGVPTERIDTDAGDES